jgi:2-oxoacid:acceptor oxidoreductase gamma subunit (pyruvate/2-ketoisovalerate family)
MIEIIFYGRGGQGVVVASKTLAAAFFHEGKYVQSFPAFGGERRGAPVKAFLRVDEKCIRRRCLIYRADHALVLDDTLLEEMPIQAEVKNAASVAINSASPPEIFTGIGASCVGTVNANAIAEDLDLGTAVMPIVNSTMLGAFAMVSRTVDMESLSLAIQKNIRVRSDDNIAGARKAYEKVRWSTDVTSKGVKGGRNG